jgi:hypothetical protein
MTAAPATIPLLGSGPGVDDHDPTLGVDVLYDRAV